MNTPSLCGYKEIPIETGCSLATLYINGRPGGNGYLFFFLIVFTSAFSCAWKTCRFSGFHGRLQPAFTLATKRTFAGSPWARLGQAFDFTAHIRNADRVGRGARRPDYGAAFCSAWG
jgi:hypothetical protein